MEVEIRLFATFREFLPEGSMGYSFRKSVGPGTTVAGILTGLNLPPETPAIVIVNGSTVAGDYVPAEGEVISIFPPVEGG